MAKPNKSIVKIVFNVELEVEYDSFEGRTPSQFADVIHDDLIDALWDMRGDDVVGLFTDIVDITAVKSLETPVAV